MVLQSILIKLLVAIREENEEHRVVGWQEKGPQPKGLLVACLHPDHGTWLTMGGHTASRAVWERPPPLSHPDRGPVTRGYRCLCLISIYKKATEGWIDL